MKIRKGFVSNSSSSSFIVNCLWYGGLVTAPIVLTYIVLNSKESIKLIRENVRRFAIKYLKI